MCVWVCVEGAVTRLCVWRGRLHDCVCVCVCGGGGYTTVGGGGEVELFFIGLLMLNATK